MRVFIVVACFVALCMPSRACAERSVEAKDAGIVLVPESRRPVWTWLRRATAENDSFIDGSAIGNNEQVRRWRPAPLKRGGRDFVSRGEESGKATSFAFTVGKDVWWVLAGRRHHLVYYGEHFVRRRACPTST